MKVFLRGLMIAAAAIAISGCSKSNVDSEARTLAVSAFYKERIALPPTAELVVSFEEYNEQSGAGMSNIHQRMQTKGQQLPYTMTLDIPANSYSAKKSYSVSARIEAEGKTIFATDKRYPVLTDPNNTVSVNLELVRSGSFE